MPDETAELADDEDEENSYSVDKETPPHSRTPSGPCPSPSQSLRAPSFLPPTFSPATSGSIATAHSQVCVTENMENGTTGLYVCNFNMPATLPL